MDSPISPRNAQQINGDNYGVLDRRPLVAAILGNAIEYYDHSLYGLFAAYLAVVFFDSSDPAFALLATYATFYLIICCKTDRWSVTRKACRLEGA
ncbi:MAG: hypothetical protein IPP45_18865 [Sphingomonadales bacterium]|nr:hypothetical protein [Sphingomonadales bacterium]